MSGPNLKRKATNLIRTIEKEGEILLNEGSPDTWGRKPDGTYCSPGEVALEKRLREILLSEDMFPEAVFIGEETSAGRELERGRTNIVLDPVDGSALKRLGLPIWGISLAVLDGDFNARLAVLHYPALRRWFVCLRESGRPTLHGVEFRSGGPCLRIDGNAAQRAVPPGDLDMKDAYVYFNSSPRVVDLTRLRCKARAMGCTSYHIAALADGQGDPLASAVYGFKIYDVAAALAIADSCGLAIYDLSARRTLAYRELMAFPRKKLDCRPLLVGHPDVLDELENQVRLKRPPVAAVGKENLKAFPAALRTCVGLGLWHRETHIEICHEDKFLILITGDGTGDIPGGVVNWLSMENRPESGKETAVRILMDELELFDDAGKNGEALEKEIEERLDPLSEIEHDRSDGEKRIRRHIAVFRLRWENTWGDPSATVSGEENEKSVPVWLSPDKILAEFPGGAAAGTAMALFLERIVQKHFPPGRGPS